MNKETARYLASYLIQNKWDYSKVEEKENMWRLVMDQHDLEKLILQFFKDLP